MDRRQYYFDQLVSESELNDGFAGAEAADRAAMFDQGIFGVMANGVVTQHSPTPDLTVDVSGQCAGYDQQGRRVYVPSNQTVNLAVDFTAVSTAVATPGNEKVISVFVRFKRANSDGRTDGNGVPLFFIQNESFEFVVRQGAEATAGSAVPHALETDGFLLADVTINHTTTQIFNAAISTARRQDAFNATAGSLSIHVGTTVAAAAALLTILSNHVTNLGAAHPASAITYAGSGTWADATTVSSTNVEAAIDEVVSDLGASTGAVKIGGAATGNFADGNPVAAGSVQALVNGIVSALAATTGAAKIGGATTTPVTGGPSLSGTVAAQLVQLGNSSSIGVTPAGTITTHNVQAALNELDSKKVGNAIANTLTAAGSIIGTAASHGSGMLDRVNKIGTTSGTVSFTVGYDQYRIPTPTGTMLLLIATPTVAGVRCRFTKPGNSGAFQVRLQENDATIIGLAQFLIEANISTGWWADVVSELVGGNLHWVVEACGVFPGGGSLATYDSTL